MSQPPPLPSANPYAAPVAHVDDVPVAEIELADRAVRLAAAILDGLLLFGPIFLLGIFGGMMSARSGSSGDTAFAVLMLLGLAGSLTVVVINCVLLHRNGQTIAKRMLSIRIVRVDGSPCSLLRVIFARWLPVTVMGMIPLLGYVISLVDPLLIFRDDRRCLHDLIADTIVVKA